MTSDPFADLGDLFVLPLTLVPRRRLGELLRHHREAEGLDLAAVATRSAGAVNPRELRRLEANGTVPEAGLETTIRAYGVDPGMLVPPRRALDLDEGGSWVSADRLHEPWPVDGGGLDELVLRYLALVYALRNQKPGSRLALRAADLDALGRATGRTLGEVARLAARVTEKRSGELAALTAEAHQRLNTG